MNTVDALILAAGKGTRMRSDRPKVLQTLLGESMFSIVCGVLHDVPEIRSLHAVVGHEAELVMKEADAVSANLSRKVACIVQNEQLGTGHALMTALPALHDPDKLLVINGDSPLITADLLRFFIREAEQSDIAFLSLDLEDAGRYGRVVRKDGKPVAIVEAKDFDEAVHGPLEEAHEVNSGIWLLSLESVRSLLPCLTNANKSGEYYLTDIVSLGAEKGCAVLGICADAVHAEKNALLGVNTPAELAGAELLLQQRRNSGLLSSGVILHSPESIRIGPSAEIAPGAEIFGPAEIYGKSQIGKGAVVRSHCVLKNAAVSSNAEIREFCHIERAVICENAIVGPFARLREGTTVGESAHVGDFVELKKTHLGKGSKANHLSYLGDAEIGSNVNIGAGTITCNYDGKNKHRTEIGDNSFIGSNSAIVAPVSVGRDSLIGAGSVITEDVPEGMLALGRGRQVNKDRRR